MAVDNKPEDDAKAMYEEYSKGTPINDIAEKYNHTPHEVETVVTDYKPAETKKEK